MKVDITISAMSEADVPFAIRLTDIEKWGTLPDDFRRLIYFEPEGCFAAWHGDRRVGIITTTSYGDYGFLGNLIVCKEYRGRQIGETLMNHAIGYLRRKGASTIELDGVFPAVSLYRRLGFADKYLSLRFFRPPRSEGEAPSQAGTTDSRDFIGLDGRLTGIGRQRMLHRYLAEFERSFYMEGGTELSAFAFVRPRSEGRFMIAPLVAADDAAAGSLLSRIVADYAGRGLSMGVPETNRIMVDLLTGHGFMYAQPSLRMYMGEKRAYEKHVYAILSPDKG